MSSGKSARERKKWRDANGGNKRSKKKKRRTHKTATYMKKDCYIQQGELIQKK